MTQFSRSHVSHVSDYYSMCNNVILALITPALCFPDINFLELREKVYPPQQAPHLEAFVGDVSAIRSRICIVTAQLKNSNAEKLASEMLQNGHDVHVVVVAPETVSETDLQVHLVDSSPAIAPLNTPEYALSTSVYNTISSLGAFDVIHFQQGSLGFVSFEAKQSGLAFSKTTLVASLARAAPTTAPTSLEALVDDFMSRRSAELADVISATSQRVVDSFGAIGYKFTAPIYSNDKEAALVSRFRAPGVVEVQEHPLVSVVVPTFNRAKLLLEAVKSIDAQTYPNIQMVVVDDGSTDPQVASVLEKLEKRANTLVIRQSNKYLGAARNRGSKEANGAYVVFLDDDNVAYPEMVSTLVTAALTSSADIVVSAHTVWDESVGQVKENGQVWYPVGPAPLAGLITNVFGNANFLIDRATFIELEGFTTDRMSLEDYEFHAKATLDGISYCVVPAPLLYYRIHDRQTQMLQQMDQEEAYSRVLRSYANVLEPEDHAALRKRTGPLVPECFILGYNVESCGDEITLNGRVYISGVSNQRRAVYAGLSPNILPEVAVNNSRGGFKDGSTWRHNNNGGVTGNFQVPLNPSFGPLNIELSFNVEGNPVSCFDASGNSVQTVHVVADVCCCYPQNSMLGTACAPQTLATTCLSSGGMCWQGDFDSDGDVDVSDLATFLTLYGPCECFPCPADFDIDGDVAIEDLVQLLVRFGSSTEYAPTNTCCCKYSPTDPTKCIPNVKTELCVSPYLGCA